LAALALALVLVHGGVGAGDGKDVGRGEGLDDGRTVGA